VNKVTGKLFTPTSKDYLFNGNLPSQVQPASLTDLNHSYTHICTCGCPTKYHTVTTDFDLLPQHILGILYQAPFLHYVRFTDSKGWRFV